GLTVSVNPVADSNVVAVLSVALYLRQRLSDIVIVELITDLVDVGLAIPKDLPPEDVVALKCDLPTVRAGGSHAYFKVVVVYPVVVADLVGFPGHDVFLSVVVGSSYCSRYGLRCQACRSGTRTRMSASAAGRISDPAPQRLGTCAHQGSRRTVDHAVRSRLDRLSQRTRGGHALPSRHPCARLTQARVHRPGSSHAVDRRWWTMTSRSCQRSCGRPQWPAGGRLA